MKRLIALFLLLLTVFLVGCEGFPALTTPIDPSTESTPPIETTPVDTTPVDTTPVDTAPVGTTPAETTPAGTAPAGTTPTETTPTGTLPDATTPVETLPAATTPVITTPAPTAPVATAPADTTPVPTAPAETTPAATAPAETTPASTEHVHAWTDWEITRESTCRVKGVQRRECACGTVERDAVSLAPHQYENGFCTMCSVSEDGSSYLESSYIGRTGMKLEVGDPNIKYRQVFELRFSDKRSLRRWIYNLQGDLVAEFYWVYKTVKSGYVSYEYNTNMTEGRADDALYSIGLVDEVNSHAYGLASSQYSDIAGPRSDFIVAAYWELSDGTAQGRPLEHTTYHADGTVASRKKFSYDVKTEDGKTVHLSADGDEPEQWVQKISGIVGESRTEYVWDATTGEPVFDHWSQTSADGVTSDCSVIKDSPTAAYSLRTEYVDADGQRHAGWSLYDKERALVSKEESVYLPSGEQLLKIRYATEDTVASVDRYEYKYQGSVCVYYAIYDGRQTPYDTSDDRVKEEIFYGTDGKETFKRVYRDRDNDGINESYYEQRDISASVRESDEYENGRIVSRRRTTTQSGNLVHEMTTYYGEQGEISNTVEVSYTYDGSRLVSSYQVNRRADGTLSLTVEVTYRDGSSSLIVNKSYDESENLTEEVILERLDDGTRQETIRRYGSDGALISETVRLFDSTGRPIS